MHNPKLAARYAKSLMDIALEQQKLEILYSDMLFLKSICGTSHEFTALLKSPIVKSDAKMKIIKALVEGKVDSLTLSYLQLIVHKTREAFLPEIIQAFISQYKKHKNIVDVKLTTATPLDENLLSFVRKQVESQFPGMTVDLATAVNENLIGGFIAEANNNQFDATI
jgi:ATP synthase, F1 delta subunit